MTNDPLAFMHRHAAVDRLQAHVNANYIARVTREVSHPREIVRWGLEFRSCNRLDGNRSHIVMRDCMPALFHTRQEARAYAAECFGYIRDCADLRREPHGWRMPVPVRVAVGIERKRGMA
jgi:hypothetical protein